MALFSVDQSTGMNQLFKFNESWETVEYAMNDCIGPAIYHLK